MPEIDIWRAALLMLKRFGDKASTESAMRDRQPRDRRRSRRYGDLAPDHRCRRAAGEHNADGAVKRPLAQKGPVNPLHLVACDLVARCGREFLHTRLAFAGPGFKRAARLDVGRAGHASDKLVFEPSFGRSASDHAVGIGAVQFRQLAGLAGRQPEEGYCAAVSCDLCSPVYEGSMRAKCTLSPGLTMNLSR